MYRSKLFLIFFLLSGLSFSNVYFSGRGLKINASSWEIKNDKVVNSNVISDDAEAFACVKSIKEKKIYFGGAKNNKGIIWIKDIKKETIVSENIPESIAVYTLCIDANNTIYAGGLHVYMGGFVWKKEEGKDWSPLPFKDNSSFIATLKVDEQFNLYAGGISNGNGKVWIYSKGEWSRGHVLKDSSEVNAISVSKEVIYAAGNLKNHKAGIWTFKGSSWEKDTNLKFANAIYTSTIDNNTIYLGGAGDENKVLWENSEGFWNAIELENCLALYALFSDGKNNVYAAGWNKQRKGRFWIKKGKSNWNKGADLENCFVVRSIS